MNAPATVAHESTAREQVLRLLRDAAQGKAVDVNDLVRLATAIESDAQGAEERIAEAASKIEPVPLPPQPVIPPLDEAIAIAAERKLTKIVDPASMVRMKFEDAARVWFDANKARWKKRTAYGNRFGIEQLGKFFAGIRLDSVHIGHLLAYQEERTENPNGRWKKKSGVSNTNHELYFLSQILKMAGLWAPFADLYTPLPPEGFKKPKVMDDVEKRRFYAVAASRPEWQLALWVATITNNTSASGTELRNLQLADLLLDPARPRITVNAATAKCRVRGRSIELNAPGLEAILKCLERAKALGSHQPEHYLFPGKDRNRNKYDPTRPASDSWLNRSWRELRKAAGLPWLTPHCLRHQCITELGEKGAAPEVIRNIAGHVSEAMMRHYTNVRRDQQAAAVKLLESPVTKAKPVQKTGPVQISPPVPILSTFSFTTTATLMSRKRVVSRLSGQDLTAKTDFVA